MADEFERIRTLLRPQQGVLRADVRLGIGDDAAVMAWPGGVALDLVASVDTLVAGCHFFPDVDPEALGHKALAVNLSDLAAMGASPAWALLSLSLPRSIDEPWLAAFMRGFAALAQAHGVALVGGDTVAVEGPLQISVTALGQVPAGRALGRMGAQLGDAIWVSGTLGDAAAALHSLSGHDLGLVDALLQRLHRPSPRVALGLALREGGLAHAMIDLSDGLLADLGHILSASRAHAQIRLSDLPRSPALADLDSPLASDWMLAGGDDYELCFTAATTQSPAIQALAAAQNIRLTRIGEITQVDASGESDALLVAHDRLRVLDAHGQTHTPVRWGYEHQFSV